MTGLHSHAAQRLVGLSNSLGKRLVKVERSIQEAVAAGQPTEPLGSETQVGPKGQVGEGAGNVWLQPVTSSMSLLEWRAMQVSTYLVRPWPMAQML